MNGFMDGYTQWIIEDEDYDVEDADGAGNDDMGVEPNYSFAFSTRT